MSIEQPSVEQLDEVPRSRISRLKRRLTLKYKGTES